MARPADAPSPPLPLCSPRGVKSRSRRLPEDLWSRPRRLSLDNAASRNYNPRGNLFCAAPSTRILMQRRQPIRSGATPHATRTILAAVLVFATLASAVHPDAVFAMVCCAGMGGEAMKDSCPFMRLKERQRKEQAQKSSEPACHHAGMGTTAGGEAGHEHHAAQGHTHHAEGGGDATGDARAGDASTQSPPSGAAAVYAAVSKPCPSECCCQANSLTRTQRPRDGAAITNRFRPRPPASEVSRRVSPSALKDDSAVRRLSPARAPPASL
jgi:hypothetical protein